MLVYSLWVLNILLYIPYCTVLQTTSAQGGHTYGVCLLNSQKTSIKIKQLKIEPSLFLAFFSIGPGDVNVFFFAVLSLLPEHLGNVCRGAIFHTPSSSFWAASWLRLRPASSLFAPANLLTVRTLSKMVKSHGDHRWDRLQCSGSLLLRLLVKQFDRSAGRLPESSRSLWRMSWIV